MRTQKIISAIANIALLPFLNISHATPKTATDQAFAALLSMHSAAPENGRWDFEQPADFQAESETELISWLAKAKRKGADLNAYCHMGTLLHHAIRSGLEDTAIWLLKNGADPKQKVMGTEQDAATLAYERKRKRVAAFLHQAPYRMKPYIQPNTIPISELTLLSKKINTQNNNSVSTVRDFIRTLHLDLYPQSDYHVYPGNITRSLDAARPILAKFSPTLIANALNDDATLGHWIAWISILPTAEFTRLLKLTPPELFSSRVSVVLSAMSQHARVNFSGNAGDGKNPVDPKNWDELMRWLPNTLAAGQLPPLLAHTETELWPRWFERKYRINNISDDLSHWLSKSPPAEFKKLWPTLVSKAPDLKQQAIRIMLHDFTLEGTQECDYEWTSINTNQVEKIEFLIQQGAAKPTLEIYPGCLRNSDKTAINRLINQGVIRPLQAPAKPRFVLSEPEACDFSFNDTWHQALKNNPTIGGDYPVIVEYVNTIKVPGSQICGLLLTGDQPLNRYVGGPQDSFDGPTDEPVLSCPDPTNTAEIWHQAHNGKIEKWDADSEAYFINGTLLDTIDNKKYWLGFVSYGRCSALRAHLLAWRNMAGKPYLGILDRKDTVQHAFVRQFDPARINEEKTLQSLFAVSDTSNTTRAESNFLRSGRLEDFLNANRSAERKAYLDAILALEKPTLKTMEEKGILPSWTREAIMAVSASTMPIPEKRARTAWLFKNHSQLAAANLDQTMLGKLTAWLPKEDWWPLLKVYRDSYLLIEVAKIAKLAGKESLAKHLENGSKPELPSCVNWQVGNEQ